VFLNVGGDVSIHWTDPPQAKVPTAIAGLLVKVDANPTAAPAVAVFLHRWIIFGGD
jgi:hypothetical protein